MRLMIGLTLGVLAGLPGCSVYKSDSSAMVDTDGGSDGEPGTTGGELGLVDFFDRAEAAYCAWAVRCGGHPDVETCRETEVLDVRFKPELFLDATFNSSGGIAVAYLLTSAEAGRIAFDAEAAASCLAYAETRSCAQAGTYAASEAELAGQAACAAVFSGTMTRNGPCMLSMECEGDRVVCGFDPMCVDACCVGGCRVLGSGLAVGAPCNGSNACVPEAYCGNDPNTGAPVCTARAEIGEACGFTGQCVAGSWCDWQVAECKVMAKVGEACRPGEPSCEPGAFCQSDDFEGDGVCRVFSGRGEPCYPNSYPDGCRDVGDYCEASSATCVARAEPGESCAGVPCVPYAICGSDGGQDCVAHAHLGEPCGEEFDGESYKYVPCAGGLQCDGYELATSRCVAPEISDTCPVPTLEPLPA